MKMDPMHQRLLQVVEVGVSGGQGPLLSFDSYTVEVWTHFLLAPGRVHSTRPSRAPGSGRTEAEDEDDSSSFHSGDTPSRSIVEVVGVGEK